MRKRALILGGAGYIGCVLVSRLLDRGYEVVVVDRLIHGNALSPSEGLTIHRADIRDRLAVASAARGCNSALHLAGVSVDGAIAIPRALAAAINLDSFEPVVQACLEAGVERFLFASTCSVYGNRSEAPVYETTTPEPNTFYGQWKLACEEILSHYANLLETVVLRAATTCGPSPRQRFDLLVNRMVASAYFKRRICISAANAIRPSVHVEDLADAYSMLLEGASSAVAGEVFHCGYENRTVRETAALVQQAMSFDVQIESSSEDNQRSYSIDSSKITDRIGFRPQKRVHDAVEGLKALFDRNQLRDALTSKKYDNRSAEASDLSGECAIQ